MAKNQEACGACQGDRKVSGPDFRKLTGNRPPAGVTYPDCPACSPAEFPPVSIVIDEAPGMFRSGTSTTGKSRHPR